MDGWILFWKITLITTVTIFCGVSLVVAIGGFFDVKAMFKDIDEEHEEEQNSGDETP
ncbi:MAG: hypothetical protein KDK99_00965 [Verrucomicrobiales bacterium]|nr:hypothetical protein [Verrucomicrobiales bacterium]